MSDIMTLSEDDLFNFPSFVDQLLASNNSFKSSGVLLFDIKDDGSGGTPLGEFLEKYYDKPINKLNPISFPNNGDLFGHISILNHFLGEEFTVQTLNKPSNYFESSGSCCTSALNDGGLEGVLSHFFQDQLPTHSRPPPQAYQLPKPTVLKQRATRLKNIFLKSNNLKPLPCAEKAQRLDELLKRKQHQQWESFCSCWKCTYSEEVLPSDEESEDNKDYSLATAEYYSECGFFYANGIEVEAADKNRISTNFSLSYLNEISLTSLLDKYYPGISNPFAYIGDTHSFFPVHTEDLSLFSVNFLHHGYPKLWIVVPPQSIGKLNYFLGKDFGFQTSCISRLSHKDVLPTPSWLQRNGIPFNVVLQRRGQGVVVTPNAAHFGFNLGPNVAEASNFGTVSWIPYGIVYPTCTCLAGGVHADLSVIVMSFEPDMLNAYQQRKIPVVSDPAFYSSLIYSKLWTEAYDNNNVVHEEDLLESCKQEELLQDVVEDEQLEQGKRKILQRGVLLKRPNRKIIKCPICSNVYQGGQKQRLLHHIKSVHVNLSKELRRSTDNALEVMFPERGTKIPKKICDICGKSVARSLKAHQESSACSRGFDRQEK